MHEDDKNYTQKISINIYKKYSKEYYIIIVKKPKGINFVL